MEKSLLIKRIRLYALLAGYVLLCLTALFEIQNFTVLNEIHVCEERQERFKKEVITIPEDIQGLYIYNYTQDEVLGEYRKDVPLPLASLTKIMTVRLALESPEILYTVTPEALAIEGDTGFVDGTQYTENSLIYSALISSSNDAAYMLSGNRIPQMNTRASELGFETLTFSSSTGLDDENEYPTAFGSAQDILDLLFDTYETYPENVHASTWSEAQILSLSGGIPITLTNTNRVLDQLPGVLASKTGYTISAGGNLATLWVLPNKDTIGAVVLGSTETGRFDAMIQIYKDVADYYRLRPILCDSFEK